VAEEALAEKLRAKMVREMALDQTYAEFPSSLSREWSIAQGHIIHSDAKLEEGDRDFELNEAEEVMAEKAFDNVMDRLGSRTSVVDRQMGNGLLEDLLLEKSLDLDQFKAGKDVSDAQKSLRQISDDVVVEGNEFEFSQLQADDLDQLSEE